MITTSSRIPKQIVRRTFDGIPASVTAARAWSNERLQDLGVDPPTDLALVLSELATNTLLHTHSGLDGGRFAVRLIIATDQIRIEVRDSGPLAGRTPARRTPRLTAEHERGLALVDALSLAWGRLPVGTGVFAEVPR